MTTLHARRRALVLLLTPMTGLAMSQTVIESALADLQRYLAAAGNLILGAASRADAIDPLAVSAAQRPEVSAELRSVSSAITRLRASNEILLMDLSSYVDGMRAKAFDEDRRTAAWRHVSRSVMAVSDVVRHTRQVALHSRWLDASLTDADRVELERTFEGRGLLLARLAQLSAPATPAEIDEVDRVNFQYRRLVESMDRLNVAVAAAARRLATT
jgi:hypothetical protein